jgi:nitrous oxidase accessory protein NosD
MQAPTVLLFATLLLTPGPATAADVLVQAGGDLQAALDGANPGDRVLVSPGLFFGNFELGDKAIELVGLGGPQGTILDGAGQGPVLHIDAGAGQSTWIHGFTIRGGAASSGAGGIQASGAAPLIEDCVVRSNSGKFGGGVSGNPVMRRCVIRDNTSSLTHGGGLYGAPQLHDCVVAYNTASSARGGGLYLTGGAALVEDSLVISNRILFGDPARGAGIAVDGNASAVLRRSVISRNTGFGNVFGSFGGGLWGNAATRVENCTITGNVLVAGNTAGAGVYGPVEITNSILRENNPDEFSGAPTISWSNVLGGASGIGNLDLDPLWVDRAFTGDLHLLPGSPCIDAGDPTTFDPDGSVADLGAFPAADLYRTNDLVAEDWESPHWSSLSTLAGGASEVRLLDPSGRGGNLYVLLGSLSGTMPGTQLNGLTLPLIADEYTTLMLLQPSAAGWSGNFGVVSSLGTAEAAFVLPPGVAGYLAGLSMHQAAVFFDPATWVATAVTEPLELPLLP